VQHDWIEKLLCLALGLEVLENVLVKLVGLSRQLREVVMVTLNECLLDEDGDQSFEFAFLVTASLYHFSQELSETCDVLLIVCDKALVSNDLDKVAEGSQAAHHCLLGGGAFFLLPYLLEDGLNVIVLDQTPKDLSAIHAEEPLEDHLVL
jgi:hypothetical protein